MTRARIIRRSGNRYTLRTVSGTRIIAFGGEWPVGAWVLINAEYEILGTTAPHGVGATVEV